MRFAHDRGVPSILEVNAPLVDEHARHREALDVAAASESVDRAIRAAALIVAVSEEVAAYVRARGDSTTRLVVEPNGIDPLRFAALHPVRERPFTLGFLGTLKPWHGLTALADIFIAVRREVPDAWLLIVGDGPERGALASALDRAGVGDACQWSGAVSPADVGEWLAQMDVGLAPYPADAPFYFSPLKIVEYMAAGVPVIASDVGQISTLLHHGIAGELIPAGDIAGFASACVRLSRAPDRRAALAAAAKDIVHRTATWDAVLARILCALSNQSQVQGVAA
jgi:glycosyltransferase involved in cell wall biosynthesis